MKTFSVTMTISVNVTIEAETEKHARLQALVTLNENLSEFDRKIDMVEDITPPARKARRGLGSY